MEGGEWVTMLTIGENYVHSLADVVYKLDISDVSTNDLRVRLVSLPAARGIDYIYADYSTESEIKVALAKPVQDNLKESDGNEAVLDRGDETELVFKFDDAISQDNTASYFIESIGYYEVWPNYYDLWPNYKIDITFEELNKALEYPYTSKIWMHRVWEKFYKSEKPADASLLKQFLDKLTH